MGRFLTYLTPVTICGRQRDSRVWTARLSSAPDDAHLVKDVIVSPHCGMLQLLTWTTLPYPRCGPLGLASASCH